MKNIISLKIISLLLLLLSTLPVGIFLSISSLNKIQDDANAVNDIGYIRGSTQQLAQNMTKEEHEKIMEEIGLKFKNIDKSFIQKNKDYLDASGFTIHYAQLKANWDELKTSYSNNTLDERLQQSLSACWYSANKTAKAATDISKIKYDEIVGTIYGSGTAIFVLLCIILFIIHKDVRNKLEINVIQDPLTELYNRSYLFQELRSRIKSYQRSKQSFSILFIDIDHFKEINDTFGHQTGDKVLKIIALLMQEALRDEDKAFRYGGEEFIILAMYTNTEEAYLLAERLRTKIAKHDFKLSYQVTISLGISEFQEDDTIDSLLTNADDAMYQAKTQGRNQTCIYKS